MKSRGSGAVAAALSAAWTPDVEADARGYEAAAGADAASESASASASASASGGVPPGGGGGGGHGGGADGDADGRAPAPSVGGSGAEEEHPSWRRRAQWATRASLVANVVLLGVNMTAFVLSRSLALLAAALDSVLDLVAQLLIISAMHYGSKNIDKARWPLGKSRLEPMAIMFMASLMGIGAFELVTQSAIRLSAGSEGADGRGLDLGVLPEALIASAIGVKMALYALCQSVARYSPSIAVLAEDHRNDVLANSVALSCAIVASRVDGGWFVDPLGAILISFYIMFRWISVARQQTRYLVGQAAPVEFHERVADLAASHHPRMAVDVVRAFFFGPRLLVEVEVVVPRDTSIVQAHDESLALQKKIEALPEVERAYVHVDYQHRDEDEHATKFHERPAPAADASHGAAPLRAGLRRRGVEQ